ncbi:MAG: undecaprenyl-diphosphate phosphatase [Anaerolineales bacterium]|jgi:undecaprenyl-diphosphatase
MTVVQAMVLGAVQGFTEFLPVSGSAHFVLVPWLLGWQIQPNPALALNVLEEMGALVAVVGFFWTDLRGLVRAGVLSLTTRSLEDPQARLAWQVALATIPATLASLVLQQTLHESLSSPRTLGGFLLATGAFLFLADHVGRHSRSLLQASWWDAIFMGVAQAIGLLPGVSRCGVTMATGMLSGLSRPTSARFSFLMAVPILLEGGIVGARGLARLPDLASDLMIGAGGFITAAVVGFFVIGWLLRYLATHSLRVFALYCGVLGSITILLSFVR